MALRGVPQRLISHGSLVLSENEAKMAQQSKWWLAAALSAAAVLGACSSSTDPDEGASGGAAGASSGGSGTGGSGTGSSSSGGSGTGGAPSGGSSSGGGVNVNCVKGAAFKSATLIDDFEDGENKVLGDDMRGGYWYVFNDNAEHAQTPGKQTPAPVVDAYMPEAITGAPGNTFAFHSTGDALFTSWGAGVGVSFVDGGQLWKCPYDLTAASGISFKYKSNAAVTFKVPTRETIPDTAHGECTAGTACFNQYSATVPAAADWTVATVKFTDLAVNPGWGWGADGAPRAPTFNKASVTELQWTIKEATAFDFWLDDVKIVP